MPPYIMRHRRIINSAVGIARMFGREVVDPVDLVLDLAGDSPPGEVLASHGLTQRRIFEWRKARDGLGQMPSMRRALEVRATAEVEEALHASSPGVEQFVLPGFGRPFREAAWIVAELLILPDDVLRSLRDEFGMDWAAVVDELQAATRTRDRVAERASELERWRTAGRTPWARVWEREKRYVFEPLRTTGPAVHFAVPTQAMVLPAGTPPEDAAARLLNVASVYDFPDLDDTDPFWTQFKERTRQGFERRARLVDFHADDVFARFKSSEHVDKNTYQSLDERQVVAPRDDLARVGRALAIAVDASRG